MFLSADCCYSDDGDDELSVPATPSKRTWVLFYFHLLANKSFIHFFKVVEQLRRHCTRRKMVGMRVPLLQVFEKGTMFTLFYLFVVAYLMLSKQTPAKTSLTKISKSLPDPSQVPVVVKSEPLDESSSLRGPGVRGPGMKKGKNKPDMRFSSPIVVSSDESDAPTPKAKTAESSNNFAFENLKKSYVQRQFFFFFPFISHIGCSAPSTPRAKGKGKLPLQLSSPVVLSDDAAGADGCVLFFFGLSSCLCS